jgi:hypothetical protein
MGVDHNNDNSVNGCNLYNFIFDENYREKHLILLKDEAIGRKDILLYY